MRAFRRPLTLLVAVVVFAPVAVDAADQCTGNIGKLPAVITKSGVFCMKKNLATSDPFVTAIDIRADNVTVDCNGFTLDGLAVGLATNAIAVNASGKRFNVTVRNCVILGFQSGIFINDNDPGGGHLVEDNRLERITANAIFVLGDGSVVRRNVVLDMIGKAQFERATGIVVFGDAIDNVVDGMAGAPDAVNFSPEGIYAGGVGNLSGVGFVVQGNRVRNLVPKGSGFTRGIVTAAPGASIRGNTVIQPTMTTGQGLFCSLTGAARDNDVANYTQNNSSCFDVDDSNVGF